MTERCCKTCRHWDAASATDSRGRSRKHWGARCLWHGHESWLAEGNLPDWLESAIKGIGRPLLVANSGRDCRAWAARDE